MLNAVAPHRDLFATIEHKYGTPTDFQKIYRPAIGPTGMVASWGTTSNRPRRFIGSSAHKATSRNSRGEYAFEAVAANWYNDYSIGRHSRCRGIFD